MSTQGSRAGGSRIDALDLLKADHDRVKNLFREFDSLKGVDDEDAASRRAHAQGGGPKGEGSPNLPGLRMPTGSNTSLRPRRTSKPRQPAQSVIRSEHGQQGNWHDTLLDAAHARDVLGGNPYRLASLLRFVRAKP